LVSTPAIKAGSGTASPLPPMAEANKEEKSALHDTQPHTRDGAQVAIL
jgi:hypothetical protein